MLTGTTYGQLLLGKAGLFAALLLVAALARALVVRAARAAAAGADVTPTVRRLRATVGVEATLGLAVLVVTYHQVATVPVPGGATLDR